MTERARTLVELMLPECLVVASVILPVLVHILQDLRLSVELKDLRDVRDLPPRRTVLIEGPIAVV